jgi:uncharacterized membrane protein
MPPPDEPGRRAADRGVVAVEFALILPLLVILIFAAVIAGSLYLDQLQIQAAAREGARAGSIDQSLGCSVATTELAGNEVGQLACTSVRTCSVHEVSEIRLEATQTVSVPLVGDRAVTLRATSAFRCPSR